MKLTKYAELDADTKRQVKARFVMWDYGHPGKSWDGKDFEGWANDHAFYVRNDGKLAENRHYAEPAFMAD